MKKINRNGFSMIEMLVATSILLIVMIAVTSLIISIQKVSLTESMKQQTNQEARALQQLLSDSFKSSGSVLALLNVPSLLGTTPVFNGIYPFNNNDYADGVIISAGDENVVTQTTDYFNYGATTLNVMTTNLPDTANSAWAKDDSGMLIRADGYYVFRVIAVNTTSLTIRNTPLYYSGLIKPAGTYDHYNDNCTPGNGTYNSGSFVVRLDYFFIFLARDEDNNTRSLTLTIDTEGKADFLDKKYNLAVPVVFNIEDIQFSYNLKDGTVVNPDDNSNFLNKTVSAVRVFVLHKTERQKHKGGSATNGIVFAKPVMGDRAATTLPAGFFNYIYNEYGIFMRNYNISL